MRTTEDIGRPFKLPLQMCTPRVTPSKQAVVISAACSGVIWAGVDQYAEDRHVEPHVRAARRGELAPLAIDDPDSFRHLALENQSPRAQRGPRPPRR